MREAEDKPTEQRILVVRSSMIFFLPFIYLVLHTIEELPGFAAWVSRYFGSHPTDMFALQHIFIWWLVLLFCYKSYQKGFHGKWVIMATAAQIQFGLNALFHLTTFFLFQSYSPGVVVAGGLGIPLTIWFLYRVVRDGRVNKRELSWAVLWGTLIAAAAIGFLFLPN